MVPSGTRVRAHLKRAFSICAEENLLTSCNRLVSRLCFVCSAVAEVDGIVGTVVDKLEGVGVSENTLILFTGGVPTSACLPYRSSVERSALDVAFVCRQRAVDDPRLVGRIQRYLERTLRGLLEHWEGIDLGGRHTRSSLCVLVNYAVLWRCRCSFDIHPCA